MSCEQLFEVPTSLSKHLNEIFCVFKKKWIYCTKYKNFNFFWHVWNNHEILDVITAHMRAGGLSVISGLLTSAHESRFLSVTHVQASMSLTTRMRWGEWIKKYSVMFCTLQVKFTLKQMWILHITDRQFLATAGKESGSKGGIFELLGGLMHSPKKNLCSLIWKISAVKL